MDTAGVLAKAFCDCHGTGPGQLSLKCGDMVSLRWRLDENWYYGDVKGVGGLIPTNAVLLLGEQAQSVPLCRALYDLDLNRLDPEDRKECLGFLKGAVITLVRRVDENWAEGRLGDRVGIFPLQFVEPNPAALKLLARGKPNDGDEPHLRNLRGSSGRLNIDSDPHRRLSRTLTGVAKPSDVSIFNIPNHGQNQSSAVPNSPVKPVQLSSAPRMRSGSTSRTLPKGERKLNGDVPPTITMALLNPQSPPPTADGIASSVQQLSISVCAALYSYAPHRPEELELSKGEMVGVYGKFKEGWLRGLSLRTGKVGILPANYVTPVLRTSARFLEQPKHLAPGGSSMPLKRYQTLNPHAASMAFDKLKAEGPLAAPLGAVPTQPALPSGNLLRVPPARTKQGWDTVRQAFQGSNRGSIRRTANLQPPAHDLGQIYGFGRSPVLSRKRNDLLTNPIRPQHWTYDGTMPSGGGMYHTMESKHSAVKDTTATPQSILVKPDPYRHNPEKAMKSVRFSTEDAPPSTMKMTPVSPGAHVNANPQAPPTALEHWNPSAIIGRDGSASVLKDPKTILQRKPHTNGFMDFLSSNFKPSALNSQSSPCRHRVLMGYNAQNDAELNLLEGELVVVQKPRPDGRVLVTQEHTGTTGLFQSSILDILDKAV